MLDSLSGTFCTLLKKTPKWYFHTLKKHFHISHRGKKCKISVVCFHWSLVLQSFSSHDLQKSTNAIYLKERYTNILQEKNL